jgi:O-antigen ligase
MRKASGSKRARGPEYPRDANRHIRPTTGKKPIVEKAGGIALVLLAILFCSIFYQNLPSDLGLNAPNLGPTAASPGQNIVVAPELFSPDQGSTGNTLDRIIKVCMIVMSVYVIATRWSLTRAVSKSSNVGFAAFMALVPLSALWSIDSPATILRFISLASIVLVCFAISLAGWHRLRFQQLAIPPVMFILVVSLLLGIIFPDRITEMGDDLSLRGAWHGIALTKNQFGMTASLGAIICINRWLAGEGRTRWSIAGTAVAVACLILSKSNTSQFATMVAVLFMVLVMRVPVIRQRYSIHVVVAIAATLTLYELVIQDFLPGAYTLLAPIRALTGKDATFSARTMIWDVVKQHIQAAPYLGTGYGAYWPTDPTPSSPAFIFIWTMSFYPSEAHNGYLDIVNDLGYLGLICLFVFLISYVRQGLQLMRVDRGQAALYLALLFQQLVMNMSESEWFARDIVFSVVILGITCMTRALHESRLNARPAVSAGTQR